MGGLTGAGFRNRSTAIERQRAVECWRRSRPFRPVRNGLASLAVWPSASMSRPSAARGNVDRRDGDWERWFLASQLAQGAGAAFPHCRRTC